MLETLTDLDRINIKNLTLEEPRIVEAKLSFDPKRDITARDWEYMKKSLPSMYTVNHIHQAAFMRTLFPENVDELGLDQRRWDNTGEILNLEITDTLADLDFNSYAATVSIIADSLAAFPEHQRILKYKYAEFRENAKRKFQGLFKNKFDIYQKLAEVMGESRRQDFMADLAVVSREDLLAYPNLENDKNIWLDRLNNLLNPSAIDAPSAANFRLTFPDEPLEAQKNIKNIRRECIGYLQHARNSYDGMRDYSEFTTIVYSLAVLSASEIKHTDQGVELVFPEAEKGFSPTIPPIPEMRKF
ncbi:MAG: hypothetical protein Q7R49_01760 [Candidatus Daviesbacteria bacterium]|nr:hypothetical protein [Candidatus Daviesbacteria bacterium]